MAFQQQRRNSWLKLAAFKVKVPSRLIMQSIPVRPHFFLAERVQTFCDGIHITHLIIFAL